MPLKYMLVRSRISHNAYFRAGRPNFTGTKIGYIPMTITISHRGIKGYPDTDGSRGVG